MKHKVKNIFKKIREKASKLKAYVARKTAPARAFMGVGRAGGMIAGIGLAALMNGWFIGSLLFYKIPWIFCVLIAAIILALAAELLNLVLWLLFGAGKRCKTYFMVTLFMIVFDNVIGNQAHAIPAILIMSFLLALATDVTGRCAWAFVKSRQFKQVFAYVAASLSVLYFGLYGVFLTNDHFGKSRIDFYNQIPVQEVEQVKGFDAYLEAGSYEVASLAYGPEDSNDIVTDTLDFTIYDSVTEERKGFTAFTDLFMDYDFEKVPVKGKVWYPKGVQNCPVFFMVHGNHESNVPSYLGYEYLGEYLASNGYVVVSVDENLINASGEGNDKRAILLLENIKTLFELNETYGNPFFGLMNEELLAIGGHSRGGEMVATAYLFNELDAYPEDGNIKFDYHFHISSIVAIAPVVDQYRPVSHSVRISDVNYLLIHGANDQDVSNMMGEKQYNNVTFSGEDFYLKSSVYILGANHGQFNSLWGRYDSAGICNHYLNTNGFLDEADQKRIAKAYIRAFLDATLNINHTHESLLSDISAYRDSLPKTVYLTNYTDTEFISLCSFDDTTDIANGANGAVIECTGCDTWTISTYDRGDGGEGENYVLDLSWKEESEPVLEVSFPAIDISNGCISFEIADMREDTEDLAEGLEYQIELRDASGNTVSALQPVLVYHSLAVQLARQDALFGTYEYKHQLQQVTINPSLFEAAGFDFTKVVSMKIVTDGKEEGELILNNLGLWTDGN